MTLTRRFAVAVLTAAPVMAQDALKVEAGQHGNWDTTVVEVGSVRARAPSWPDWPRCSDAWWRGFRGLATGRSR